MFELSIFRQIYFSQFFMSIFDSSQDTVNIIYNDIQLFPVFFVSKMQVIHLPPSNYGGVRAKQHLWGSVKIELSLLSDWLDV